MASKDDDENYEDSSFETPSPEKKGAPKNHYTYKLQVEGKVVGEVALPTNADWKDFLKAAKAKVGFQFECVRYDDEQEEDLDIECGDQTAWEQLGEMMEEETEFYKGVITLRVETKLSAAAAASSKNEITAKVPCAMTENRKDPAGGTKGTANVPEAMVRKLLLAKRKILEGCAAKDKSGLGLVTTAELSKQMQEIIGCSAEQAEALVWSGGAWREIVPNGQGQMVDYKLFCLRVRLVDAEEAALLSALSNPDLQAARMAILERPSVFKELLSEFDGPVTAKQCEDILKEKGQHIMGKNHAAALCARPGSLAAQKDFRVLADELELVDTLRLHRSALLNMVILGCVRDFAMLGDNFLKDARDASADRGNVLPADKFCAVFEKCDADSFCRAHSLLEAPELPHTVSKSILTPILSAVTGALRQDLRVNFETFASDLSIAHDSEIRILRAGRHETLQMLRRQVLKERAFIIKELGSEQSLENFKKIVMAKPLSFSEQDAEKMCADVPKGQDGKQAVLKHIDKLQFSEILGTEIDECANALFAKYKELCSTCENKEPRGKEGSIRMEDFADAMDMVAVDNDMAKKVRQVLSDEGVELVAWRELLECRMRVLSWRELEILKRLRDKTDQTSRLKALAVSARVFVSLADDTDDHDMVSFECVKAKFISLGSLSEDESEKIVEMLRLSPLATPDKIHCTDVLGLRSYIASRDCDAGAIKKLMSSRQRFLDACCGSEGSSAEPPPPRETGPEVDVTAVRSAMHRVHLPAWAVDAVMGFADRAHKDQSKVQLGSYLSHMAVVTGSELRRLEMLADDRVQLARLALVKVDPTGGSCPKERLGSLVTELITKVDAAIHIEDGSPLKSSLHEGIALALLSMKESYTVAEKKGSLTSEDLVRSLTAVMCDFEMPLPFSTAADLASAGPGTTAASAPSATRSNVTSSKDGMTPGQRVFYDKIIKPRKPGIKDMMEMMRGMPASILLSPLRELQRAGHNLPSAAVQHSEQRSSSGTLSLSVLISGAEGVPVTDKFDVIGRRARACLVHIKSKTFVAGAFMVPTSERRDKGGTTWTFSDKGKNGNPFMVRAPKDADYKLYIELSLLTKKKGSITEGQQAINNNDIKEFSCGFVCLTLNDELKPGNHKLDLFGGTPWAPVEVKASDLQGQKKDGGFFSRFKKVVSQVSLVVKTSDQKDMSPELDAVLPRALVCNYRVKDALAEFCKLKREMDEKTQLFMRPDANDMVLSTFPTIMDSPDMMIAFCERWDKANPSKADEKAEAFRLCVTLFYPIVNMDSAKMPRFLDAGPNAHEQEKRSKVLESFSKAAKSKEKLVEQLLSCDDFRGAPFRVDELIIS